MIKIKYFSYYFFQVGKDSFRKVPILTLGLIILLTGNALGQRLGAESSSSGPRPRLGSTQPTRLGITQPTRLGVVERSQRLGVQQVGEATAEATRLAAVRPAGPEVIVDRADRLVEQGKFEEAISIYRKVLETNPNLASADMGLGYAFIKMGEFDSAVNQYKKVVEYAPSNAEAQLNLGVALYRGGRIKEAIEQYKKALQENKKGSAAANFNLAMAYAHDGEFDKSVEHYQIAIKEKGNNYPSALNNLGLVYEAMGKLDLAAQQFNLAIEQQKGSYPLARYNLARLYSKDQKTYQKGVEEFKLAIKQQPNFAEAHLDLANLYLIRTLTKNTNEMELAIDAYKKAIDLRDGVYPLAHENLGIAYAKKGNKGLAYIEYRTAFEQYDGQSTITLKNMVTTIEDGESFIITNELSRADNAGNLTSKKSVVSPNKLIEDVQKVLDTYDELDEEAKDQPDVRYCAGLAFVTVGDWGSAADELARAVKLSEKAGKKDEGANRALNSIMELVRYF
jgi:tetratricopeptide (TPR) repeat protein